MTNAGEHAPLSKRIKESTRPIHEALDQSVMARHLFDDAQGYRKFALMNYLFHRDLNDLYQDPALAELVPNLVQRNRLALLELDLADLDVARPAGHAEPVPHDISSAIGWLYVAEGSKLGANFLGKLTEKMGFTAEFGARHFAPDPGGRGESWNAFREALDRADVDAALVIKGAQDGFARVRHYLGTLTEPAPQGA